VIYISVPSDWALWSYLLIKNANRLVFLDVLCGTGLANGPRPVYPAVPRFELAKGAEAGY